MFCEMVVEVERVSRKAVVYIILDQDETFRKSKELPADLFATSMGVFWGDPQTVILDFAPSHAPYVQGRQWHPSQQRETTADGRVRMTLQVSIDYALKSWILSFGAGVKVLEPKSLADDIRKEHQAALGES